MRFLFDSSALLQIFCRRPATLAFIGLLVQRKYSHVTSAYILAEVERSLPRLGVTRQQAKVATRRIAKHSQIVTPGRIPAIARDSSDDPILAAALEGGVRYLVTNDSDLLCLKSYEGIKIITPEEFYSKTL